MRMGVFGAQTDGSQRPFSLLVRRCCSLANSDCSAIAKLPFILLRGLLRFPEQAAPGFQGLGRGFLALGAPLPNASINSWPENLQAQPRCLCEHDHPASRVYPAVHSKPLQQACDIGGHSVADSSANQLSSLVEGSDCPGVTAGQLQRSRH